VLLECYNYWWNESKSNSSWITHGEALNLDPSKQSNILFDVEAVHIAATARWLSFTKFTIDFSDYGHTLLLPSNGSAGSAAWFALGWTSDNTFEPDPNGLNSFCKYFNDVLLKSSLKMKQMSEDRQSYPAAEIVNI